MSAEFLASSCHRKTNLSPLFQVFHGWRLVGIKFKSCSKTLGSEVSILLTMKQKEILRVRKVLDIIRTCLTQIPISMIFNTSGFLWRPMVHIFILNLADTYFPLKLIWPSLFPNQKKKQINASQHGSLVRIIFLDYSLNRL